MFVSVSTAYGRRRLRTRLLPLVVTCRRRYTGGTGVHAATLMKSLMWTALSRRSLRSKARQNTHLLIERRRYRQPPTFLLLLPS